jgi:UDP-glucose 4-epimerase
LSIRQRSIVTGAHGFVGRHVARCLHSAGYIVYGIGHGDWGEHEFSQWGLTTWLSADITLETLRALPLTPDLVIHCAGGGSVSAADQYPLRDFEQSVHSTAHVLEYLRTAAPGARLVYPSSASVYGNCTLTPIPEDAPLTPFSQYGVHKLMAEQLIRSYTQRFAIPAAIVRLFSAYGPGLRKQLLWDACQKLTAGDTLFMGTGNELRDWLHVDDAAGLLVKLAEHADPSCPTMNGGTGIGVSTRELLAHLAHCLLRHPGSLHFSNMQRTGDPVSYVADISAAMRVPWQPIHTWQAGVAQYVDWWISQSPAPSISSMLSTNTIANETLTPGAPYTTSLPSPLQTLGRT